VIVGVGARQNFCIWYKNKNMKARSYTWMLLIVVMLAFSSCEAIGDIFQAGMTVGIIVVVAVVALVIWLVSRFRR
jgi:hypothetical protein